MTAPTIMMTLGGFQFGLNTAAYQELARVTEYRWPAQEPFMQGQALQFIGPGGDTITLPGVIYPGFRGGTGQLDAMRALADGGEPMTMIDGTGNVMGRWVIERVEERGTIFAGAGVARKQEFTLGLRKFDDASSGGGLGGVLGAVAAALPIDTGPLAQLPILTASTATQAAGFASSLAAAAGQVTDVAAQIGGTVNSVLTPINRAVGIAAGLKNAANDAKQLLGPIPSALSGASSARHLLDAANTAVMNSSTAGSVLKRAVADLQALGSSVPASAIRTVEGALATVNRLTVAATQTQADASTILKKLEPTT